MGYRIIADIAGLAAPYHDEHVIIDDPFWHGYLTNISPREYAERFEQSLPRPSPALNF